MNNKLIYGLIGVFIGGALVLALMNIIVKPSSLSMMPKSTSNSKVSDQLDAHFIEQMIPHHEDAITMARLAEGNAQSPEVKRLALSIIESQGREISQMKGWYRSWFKKEVPSDDRVTNEHRMMGNDSRMNMGMAGDKSDMERLTDSQDFDREFIEQMIPHHQMAIMMANMLKTGTAKSEMRTLAENIILDQTREINMMRDWLAEWK